MLVSDQEYVEAVKDLLSTCEYLLRVDLENLEDVDEAIELIDLTTTLKEIRDYLFYDLKGGV